MSIQSYHSPLPLTGRGRVRTSDLSPTHGGEVGVMRISLSPVRRRGSVRGWSFQRPTLTMTLSHKQA